MHHCQSQGGAERFNRTLLGMICKGLDSSHNWVVELDMLLYQYRTRPHSVSKISPMRAMFGWESPDAFVEKHSPDSASIWVDGVCEMAARVQDYMTDILAEHDDPVEVCDCPYSVGDSVLLRQPSRRQKHLPPYEYGWSVNKVLGPRNVVINRLHPDSGQHQEKVVNIELLKSDVGANVLPDPEDVEDMEDVEDVEAEGVADAKDEPIPDHGYSLRDRSGIHTPLAIYRCYQAEA